MRKPLRIHKTWIVGLAITIVALGTVISVLVFATGDSRLTVKGYSDLVRFQAEGVATLQVRIFDLSGKVVWDSGMVSGDIIDWDRRNDTGERLAYGAYIYSAQGWNAQGGLDLQKRGKLALMPGDEVQLQAAPAVESPRDSSPQVPTPEGERRYAPMIYSHSGDFTISGNLGVGTDAPRYPLQVEGGAARLVARFLSSEHPIAMVETTTAGNNATFSMRGPSQEWRFEKIGTSFWQVKDVTADTGPFRIYTGAPWGSITIASSGRVGIGTTSPSATLEVHGSATNLLALYDPIAPSDPKFRVEKTGTVYADGAYYGASFNTGSADVAERINTSEWVEKGDVVEIDPAHPGFFRKARSPYSTKVAGIISISPGVILGNTTSKEATDDWDDNRPVLAITGRVPCKVATENGPIQIGDLLVASSTPGVAMKGNPEELTGAVVGKAMEPLEEGEGTIVVQVMLR